MSPGQQLKDAGSVSLNGGRVQSGFGLSLNLPKVETVQQRIVAIVYRRGMARLPFRIF